MGGHVGAPHVIGYTLDPPSRAGWTGRDGQEALMRRQESAVGIMLVAIIAVVAAVLPAAAQDRTKTKEVVVGLGAEPRTMLAVTIVDWTTNNMLEHIYDRLLDRDAKTLKPKP